MKHDELKLGLDLGTNSVGWALLDQDNKLVKKNGFTFWGVRMFEEANTAVSRRSYRNSRRGNNRRKQRIILLQDLFKDEIDKLDTTFFQRLEDSFYKQEDKINQNFYNLFTEGYTDKDYFNKFPTIYHLRKYLIENDEKVDIRLLYLTIHNIVKYRGNFLIPGEEFKASDYESIKEHFIELNNIISDLKVVFEEDEAFTDEYFSLIDDNRLNDAFFQSLKEIIVSKVGIRDKKLELMNLFAVPNKSLINEAIIPFLAGSDKINVSSLSIIKHNKYEKIEVEIASEALPSKIEEGKQMIPDFSELLDFYLLLKEIVDFYYVVRLLDKYKNYSEAMVGIYDEHQRDLRRLKRFVKTYIPREYNNIFRKTPSSGDKKGLNNYPKYIGMNDSNSKRQRFGHCTRSDFYKFLKEKLDKVTIPEALEEKDYFLKKIENNELLLRQNSDQNGSFPMQLHLQELKAILKNQRKYYPFLCEIQDGITVTDKIVSIFKFKLPYFVGPTNKESQYSWLVRSDDKIYPWNYDKIINMDETAINFITKMQNKCTYLKGDNDYSLPKKSIIFSEYNCLSYLNKLNVNGSIISNEVKMKLFEGIFLTKKKPTKKDIINVLHNDFDFDVTTTKGKEIPDVNCDMSSYLDFKNIFGKDFENNRDKIENIIRDITIFEDKSILERRLYNVYGLSKDIVKQIKGLNYKDYSRLCKNLLVGLPVANVNTGEIVGSVLDVMRSTNMNLQEIIFNPEFNFYETINSYNAKYYNKEKDDIEGFIDENIMTSPTIKRSIIQTVKIIEDIEKALGQKIDKYYIEVTRSNQQEKKATDSRYKALKDKYKKCKDWAADFNINLKNLEGKLDKEYEKNKNILMSDKYYFYFSQLGKCMYTLENIDFDDLLYNNKYDIDHIYPQALIKDDSLSNRVLTNKKKNASKTDNMISDIPDFLPKEAYAFYEKLLDGNLITKSKYEKLTKKEFSEDELNGFVNRQVVSTNQSVKGLIEVLKGFFNINPQNIIYSKAENVSDFRHNFDLVKSRLANNFHHAHDAYLNVIVGGTLDSYFKSKKYYYFKDYERIKNDGYSLNPEIILNKESIVIDDKEIWNKDQILSQIKYDLYSRYDVHETTRTYCKNDMLSKVTIVPAKEVKNNVPMKTNSPRANMEKYGGVTSYSYSKYIIIKNLDKKGIEKTMLIPIPRPYVGLEREYLKNNGFLSCEILVNEIKVNTVVEYGNLRYMISGVTGSRFILKNARDRYFDYNSISTIKKIEKYFDNKKKQRLMEVKDDYIIVAFAKDKKCKEIRLVKDEVINLLYNIKKIYSRDIYDFSIIHSAVEKLDDRINDFVILDLVTLSFELLRLLKTNAREEANLSLIGEKSNCGSISMSSSLSKGMRFIIESPTGYYKKVLFEVK